MIALPDFGPGAMENFGAITYRETLPLVDEKSATLEQKKDVALTVAHEVAHQWFGDLVTMQWWAPRQWRRSGGRPRRCDAGESLAGGSKGKGNG